jgi:hypothetical protein
MGGATDSDIWARDFIIVSKDQHFRNRARIAPDPTSPLPARHNLS